MNKALKHHSEHQQHLMLCARLYQHVLSLQLQSFRKNFIGFSTVVKNKTKKHQGSLNAMVDLWGTPRPHSFTPRKPSFSIRCVTVCPQSVAQTESGHLKAESNKMGTTENEQMEQRNPPSSFKSAPWQRLSLPWNPIRKRKTCTLQCNFRHSSCSCSYILLNSWTKTVTE